MWPALAGHFVAVCVVGVVVGAGGAVAGVGVVVVYYCCG